MMLIVSLGIVQEGRGRAIPRKIVPWPLPELGAVVSLMAGWDRTSEMTGSMPCVLLSCGGFWSIGRRLWKQGLHP